LRHSAPAILINHAAKKLPEIQELFPPPEYPHYGALHLPANRPTTTPPARGFMLQSPGLLAEPSGRYLVTAARIKAGYD
jgi:hypothetical protein